MTNLKIHKKFKQVDATGDIKDIMSSFKTTCCKIKELKREYDIGKKQNEYKALRKIISKQKNPMSRVKQVRSNSEGKANVTEAVSDDYRLVFLYRRKAYLQGVMAARLDEVKEVYKNV